ncbi:hypothetical protein HPB50_022379 [Hyalomma asiaticum]|uniref:Uncharacterized protein n=1 Tax=Hyalomma asiaticum TaxID=266040 RepID=A0ACB7S752_HYAAI|nr:hypothetical protein HPB50_022379 [Hyalomma asiaticum]
MEDIFYKLLKEASHQKHPALRQACQEAQEALANKLALLRNPPYEVRQKCFDALQLALESKEKKLVSLSFSGLQQLLREQLFNPNLECDDEQLWLPSQLMRAISSLASHPEEAQVEGLKVILQCCCLQNWCLSQNAVFSIVTLCLNIYSHGSAGTKSAAVASASQSVQGYVSFLFESAAEDAADEEERDKNIVSAQRFEKGEMGRGSGCLTTAPSYQAEEARLVYGIALELVTIVGEVGALRPVLGSLFHRMLLYPLPQHCLEPLKFVKQLLKNPEQLLQFAGPPLWEDTKNPRLSSLDLLKIVVDGLGECCHSNEPSVCYISVECVVALLSSLETLVSGSRISDQMAERLNATFPTLQSADYVGASFLYEKSARGAFRNGWQQTHIKCAENETAPVVEETEVLNQANIGPCPDVHLEDIRGSPKHPLVEEALEASEGQYESEPSEQVPVVHESLDEQKEGNLDLESCIPEMEAKDARDQVGTTQEEGSLPDEEFHSGSYMEYSQGDEVSEFADGSLYDTDLAEKPLEEETDVSADARTPVIEGAAKTLMKDANESERNRLEKFFESNNEFAKRERRTAQEFVDHLASFLPRLLHIRSSIEADQELQQFASDYAETLWQQQQQQHNSTELEGSPNHITIVNADGIYLATYSALLLGPKAHPQWIPQETHWGCTEKFVDEVHGSGVLVYLSATWLSELYQQVLARSLLCEAGYEPESKTNLALINLLTGMKFARHVLTACWDTMLEVLSVLLNGTNSCGIASSLGLLLGTDGAKEDHRKAREAVANCLDGLQCAAKLCNVLGLQMKCGAIFAQLAAASCPALDSNGAAVGRLSRQLRKASGFDKAVLYSRSKSVRLHASHVLSMDVLLSRGLELGSHSAVCWRHVFRCCCYILELEQRCFQVKPASSSPSGSSHLKLQLSSFSWGEKVQQALSPKAQPPSDCLLLQPPSEHFEEEMAVEALSMPGVGHAGGANVVDLVKNATQASGSSVLMGKQLQPIIEALSQLVDRLFDEAAGKLNLCALVDFLSELCAASRKQLFKRGARLTARHSVLLLNRLSEVMLRCSRGGRPLVHIMKAWSVVAPHFVEVACHKDPVVAKRAVTSIHDIVGALLSTHIDLPHFHFNEALFKPFENILCLELCDVDIQEQIVSCICEFVEGSTAEIRSGWRPLFGALRAVRMPCTVTGLHTSYSSSAGSAMSEREQLERTHHLRVVLDVFDAFLGTDNPSVFANAAVDCLLCLLKHVRGPAELQDQADPEACLAQDTEVIPLNLCQAALRYLERCAQMLSSMIKFNSEPNCVDPVLPNMELILFKEPDSVSQHSDNENAKDEGASKAWYIQSEISEEPVPASVDQTVSLAELDQPTGVLHVWFLLLEGLAGAVATCPRRYQPHTIDTLFQMLRGLREVPGPEFGVYAVNHLLLPMLQGWLRRASKTYRGWDGFANNFKQCCGLATELVVEYLGELSASGSLTQVRGLMLMVHQLFLVLAECIAQPVEVVSRLGCACMRHLLVSGGPSLSPDLWRVAASSVWRATRATLLAAQQLMVCFHAGSENFYGDVGQAKVAVRRDCTRQEADRLRQLCRQVFLLDAQRATINVASCRAEPASTAVDQECSFIFLLHPPDKDPAPATAAHPSSYVVRVPFQQLVVGLLSHQILLQTLATLLLESTRFRLPALASVLACPASPARSKQQPGQYRLAGQLEVIPLEQLRSLLSVLEESYSTATDFDERPGLKFLVQKVARCEVAANLFKQAAISWAIQAVVLLELCLGRPAAQPLTMDAVNRLVASAGSPEVGDHAGRGEGEGSDDGQGDVSEDEDDEVVEELPEQQGVGEEYPRQAKDEAEDEVEDSKEGVVKAEENYDGTGKEEAPKPEDATKDGVDEEGSARGGMCVSDKAAAVDESEGKLTQDETAGSEPVRDAGAGDGVVQSDSVKDDGAKMVDGHAERGESAKLGKEEEHVENSGKPGEHDHPARRDAEASSSSSEVGALEDQKNGAKVPIDSFDGDKCQWRKRRRRRLRREQRISGSSGTRRTRHSINEASGEEWNPYRRLRSLFADLCTHYARVASPEAKEGAILDRVSDQPIFFLMAQPDTLPEILPDRRISRADSAGSAAGSEPAHRHPVPLLASDSSDSSEPEMAAAFESALQPDRVYSIVTERAIQSMVCEYKRRKTRHSMPAPVPVAETSRAAGTLRHQRSSASSIVSKRSSLSKGASTGSEEGTAVADNAGTSPPPLPTEVENQRRSSILKDAEAHVQVWSQLAQSVLELHLSLCEAEFLALVPVFYAGVEVLVNCGPAEPELRALTADWLHRVALSLGFSGSLVSSSSFQQRI